MAAVLEIPHTASFLLRDEDSTVTKIRLNPESFSVLQEAIANGMKLPASAQDFEHRYERVIFQKFLARDPSVYDVSLPATLDEIIFSKTMHSVHSPGVR